jgi:hypothetical protein
LNDCFFFSAPQLKRHPLGGADSQNRSNRHEILEVKVGGWGVGPLENDAALDLAEAWKRFRAGGYPAEYYTPEGTLDFFLSNEGHLGIGMTMDWGDVETTSRLIALAELFSRDGLAIRGRVKEYFEEAINWELRKDALDEWDDPKARKRALEELLGRIGGKRRRLTTSKLFRHPIVEFQSHKALFQKLEVWVRGIKAHKRADFPSDSEYPRLWQVFDRVMNSRVRHLGDTLRAEALCQRLMLLGAYFGIYAGLTADETMDLVRKAEERGGAIFGNATDLWKKYLTNPNSHYLAGDDGAA